MKLHANAALSLNKRRLLCRRVVVEGRTVTEAAAAAEVSVRCARKWVGRFLVEGDGGLVDRPSAPRFVANRTCERRGEAVAPPRRVGVTGPGIPPTPWVGLCAGAGGLAPAGVGKAGGFGVG